MKLKIRNDWSMFENIAELCKYPWYNLAFQFDNNLHLYSHCIHLLYCISKLTRNDFFLFVCIVSFLFLRFIKIFITTDEFMKIITKSEIIRWHFCRWVHRLAVEFLDKILNWLVQIQAKAIETDRSPSLLSTQMSDNFNQFISTNAEAAIKFLVYRIEQPWTCRK